MLLRKWVRGVEEEGGIYIQPEPGSQVPSLSVVLKKLKRRPLLGILINPMKNADF